MTLLFFLACTLSLPTSGETVDKTKAEIEKTLNKWHEAAAKPDEARYFSLMTDNAVFLGTDPLERWTKEEFQKWAHPIFLKGEGWSMKAYRRNLFFNSDSSICWFDEELLSSGLGNVRGSGVVVKEKNAWKIAQYNLSIPIRNEKFAEIRKINDKKDPAKSEK